MDAGKPCYEEAIVALDADTWQQAMISEMDSIKKNDTWKMIELLASMKPLPCKWVYRYKCVPGFDQPNYKARLVAKGFKQGHNVDYNEFFSLVVKMKTLRLLLGIVTTEYLKLEQVDIKTTFLHGYLEEDIYMSQPTSFTVTGEEGNLIC